jgi:hypothetical protein
MGNHFHLMVETPQGNVRIDQVDRTSEFINSSRDANWCSFSNLICRIRPFAVRAPLANLLSNQPD